MQRNRKQCGKWIVTHTACEVGCTLCEQDDKITTAKIQKQNVFHLGEVIKVRPVFGLLNYSSVCSVNWHMNDTLPYRALICHNWIQLSKQSWSQAQWCNLYKCKQRCGYTHFIKKHVKIILTSPPDPQRSPPLSHLCSCGPSMTLLIKLTMATAGCSGSISANRWHTFSVALPVRLATKPNILQQKANMRGQKTGEQVIFYTSWNPMLAQGNISDCD